jgi:hypothetical protein
MCPKLLANDRIGLTADTLQIVELSPAMTINLGKGNYFNDEESQRLARKILGTLKFSEKNDQGKLYSYQRALKLMTDTIRAAGDTGGWFQTYATDLTLHSDGTRITWQLLSLGETDEDRSYYEALWVNQLTQIGDDSYQLSSAVVSESVIQEHKRIKAEAEYREHQKKLEIRREEDRRKAVRRERRLAGLCELCGGKIGFFSGLFGQVHVARGAIWHKKCSYKD